MFMDYEQTDFNANSKGLSSPATVIVSNPDATLRTYNKDGTGDGTPPRAIRCDAAGTLEVVDFSGNTATMSVLQGEVLPLMIYQITANTTIVTQSMW